ncbi:hypothetical protein ACMHYB_05440 [Sorangium sp. So ce1128]
MGSNKDSDDDIRQYLPDLESIRREADPAVAERKLQQALDNPELDRALSEMQQHKATGQPLFQFPVVPALPKGQQAVPQGAAVPVGPPPLPGVAAQRGAVVPQQGAAVPPPLPGVAAQQGAAAAQHRAAVPQHGGAAAQHGGAAAQHGGAAAHHKAAVPLYGGAAAPLGAAMPGAVVPRSAAAQPGAMAPSQWADRALPPIDKALLPSSLLPVTAPPVATPTTPASAQATARRRPWMPAWLMVVLAVFAVSTPFVLAALLLREAPPKEQQPALPSSGAPARSALPPPVAPAPPAVSAPGREQVAAEGELPAPAEAVEPSLDDGAAESEARAPGPSAPARPELAVPRPPQAPAAPAPTEKPLAKELME